MKKFLKNLLKDYARLWLWFHPVAKKLMIPFSRNLTLRITKDANPYSKKNIALTTSIYFIVNVLIVVVFICMIAAYFLIQDTSRLYYSGWSELTKRYAYEDLVEYQEGSFTVRIRRTNSTPTYEFYEKVMRKL